MIFGCVAIGIAHLAASEAYRLHAQGTWVLALTLCAIAFYAMSLAPVTWVLITEIYPNDIRASALSVTVATLWAASFLLTYTFPIVTGAVGMSGAFMFYSGICFAGALFVFREIAETSGRRLESVAPEVLDI